MVVVVVVAGLEVFADGGGWRSVARRRGGRDSVCSSAVGGAMGRVTLGGGGGVGVGVGVEVGVGPARHSCA